MGLLSWLDPRVVGVGYNVVAQMLNGHLLVDSIAFLVVLKLIATTVCYGSGNAGGIFAPSLFIGAMTGGAIGGVAHLVAPYYAGGVGPMLWLEWARPSRGSCAFQ